MIVAGFGFRGAANLASMQDALEQTGWKERITALATASDKAAAPAMLDLAAALSLPCHPVPDWDVTAAKTATNSEHARRHRQTGSLAEGAALAAAGPKALLVSARVISADRMATCAIARAPSQEDTP